MKSILINTPDISILGGVANHYKGLKSYWTQSVKYNFVGGRNGVPGPIMLLYDYIKFIIQCAFGNFDVILLNPSLGKTAIKRDALFLKISKLFKIKTVVFFHGWSGDIVTQYNLDAKQFVKNFNKSDKILVLANSFKTDLINWGITCPINLTTTKVNDELISEFNLEDKKWNQNILFLTRIETYKGIFIVLEAYVQIKKKCPGSSLTIAGDGSKMKLAREFVVSNSLKDVSFLGNISGNRLINAFSNASVYVLPSYSEGMPTSVLEAMAFGIPIISRPVGGLVDFFKEEEMGHLIESLQPKEYVEKAIQLLENHEENKAIGKYNHEYAKENFMASKVALKIEKQLSELI